MSIGWDNIRLGPHFKSSIPGLRVFRARLKAAANKAFGTFAPSLSTTMLQLALHLLDNSENLGKAFNPLYFVYYNYHYLFILT